MKKQLPEKFLANMKEFLGNEFDLFIESIMDKSQINHGLRINLLKVDIKRLKETVHFDLENINWCDTGFYFSNDNRPSVHPYHFAGLYYLQEPSAMSPASVLPIKKGDRVLDLCASPGGKTTQIATKLDNTGVIVSNDINASRCIPLMQNIDLMGIKNAVVTNESSDKLKYNFPGWFDKILIDAPCSGEGMFRKDDSAINAWQKYSPKVCTNIQRKILDDAKYMLANEGIMLYSTCTFNPYENELIIKEFLDNNRNFSLVKIEHNKFGLDKGRGNYLKDERLNYCTRIWPHKHRGEGHFIALLKKEQSNNISINNKNINVLDNKKIFQHKDFKYFEQFNEKYLLKPLEGKFELRNDSLYLLPDDMPCISKIRVPKAGMYVGKLKTKRFEPSFQLALSLKKQDFRNTVSYPSDSIEVKRYLKGESFVVDSKDGYCLFCVDEFPLGFGKVINGRLKNKRK